MSERIYLYIGHSQIYLAKIDQTLEQGYQTCGPLRPSMWSGGILDILHSLARFLLFVPNDIEKVSSSSFCYSLACQIGHIRYPYYIFCYIYIYIYIYHFNGIYFVVRPHRE